MTSTNPRARSLIQLLLDWKLGFLLMTAGLFLATTFYYLLPPIYSAQATVVVDMNVEENWAGLPDNEIFYFLDREARKLVELAWSDSVLAQVESETGVTVSKLRAETLMLSQPKDGGWHFYAKSTSPERAEIIASSWALSFTEQISSSSASDNPFGILENINVTPTQTHNLPVKRQGELVWFALAGALGGWLIGLLLVLFKKR